MVRTRSSSQGCYRQLVIVVQVLFSGIFGYGQTNRYARIAVGCGEPVFEVPFMANHDLKALVLSH